MPREEDQVALSRTLLYYSKCYGLLSGSSYKLLVLLRLS